MDVLDHLVSKKEFHNKIMDVCIFVLVGKNKRNLDMDSSLSGKCISWYFVIQVLK